jgi:hypothetical protein
MAPIGDVMKTFILFIVLAYDLNAQMLSGIVTGSNIPDIPVAVPPAGPYGSGQNVTLTAARSTSIRYTISSTAPACPTTGTLYTGAISIAATATLKAIGCSGSEGGNVLIALYTITLGNISWAAITNAEWASMSDAQWAAMTN